MKLDESIKITYDYDLNDSQNTFELNGRSFNEIEGLFGRVKIF